MKIQNSLQLAQIPCPGGVQSQPFPAGLHPCPRPTLRPQLRPPSVPARACRAASDWLVGFGRRPMLVPGRAAALARNAAGNGHDGGQMARVGHGMKEEEGEQGQKQLENNHSRKRAELWSREKLISDYLNKYAHISRL